MKKILILFLSLLCLYACDTERSLVMSDKMTLIIDQNGADPWIFQKDEIYCYTKTTGNNITIFRSNELSTVAWNENKTVYKPNGYIQNIWALEIHYLDRNWYIYFAANTYEQSTHKMYVLKNRNEDPFDGEWICKPVVGMDDKFAIDGTVCEIDNVRYFIWSGWEGYENVRQDIYIAKMISPEQIENQKILLSKPEYDWEKVGNPLVNEAPQIIIKNNTVNLVYSASGSWTNSYCLGLLTANVSDNLTDSESWTKYDKPILKSGNNVYGPGHNGFAKSPDGNQDYIIYHAARWDGSGWSRSVRMQPIYFNESGIIQSLEPITEEQLLPSGEKQRILYKISDFEISENMKIDENNCIFGFEDKNDFANLTFLCKSESYYIIVIYAKVHYIYSEDNGVSLNIKLDKNENKILPIFSSEYYQPIVLNVYLTKGKHTLQIKSDVGVDKISLEKVEVIKIN